MKNIAFNSWNCSWDERIHLDMEHFMIRRKSSSLSSNYISFSAKVIPFESLIHSQTILKGSKCRQMSISKSTSWTLVLSMRKPSWKPKFSASGRRWWSQSPSWKWHPTLPTKTTYRAIPANCLKFLGNYPIIWFFAYYQFLLLICCIEIWQSFHFV